MSKRRSGRRRISTAAAAVALSAGTALGLPLPARSSNPTLPNWPALLPPRPGGPEKLLLTFDACHRPEQVSNCPARVIDEMYDRWRPLDHRCDHRAVFALTYLRTTEEFARTTRRSPDFFEAARWVYHEDAVFAQLYFRAYDRWERGGSVPAAWRIAFQAAKSPNVTGTGDLLLGMNAHINRDLPYTLAHVKLGRRSGDSHKPDHDKVNKFLDRVIDPLQRELARRYDPFFTASDAEPSPFDEALALQTVRDFRENAWRNAENLIAARNDPAQLAAVRASIENEAETAALSILVGNTVPGYGPTRDAYCRDHQRSGRSQRSRDSDRRASERRRQRQQRQRAAQSAGAKLPGVSG